jgi:hypothetical protein
MAARAVPIAHNKAGGFAHELSFTTKDENSVLVV